MVGIVISFLSLHVGVVVCHHGVNMTVDTFLLKWYQNKIQLSHNFEQWQFTGGSTTSYCSPLSNVYWQCNVKSLPFWQTLTFNWEVSLFIVSKENDKWNNILNHVWSSFKIYFCEAFTSHLSPLFSFRWMCVIKMERGFMQDEVGCFFIKRSRNQTCST